MKKMILCLALLSSPARSTTQCSFVDTSEPVKAQDTITVKSLRALVDSTPLRFKSIVVAQAVLESGWFKSKNFVQNNNLFGMKRVSHRGTLSDTSINGYAHYRGWRESVLDYCMMVQSNRRMSKIITERAYYDYLDRVYSGMGLKYSTAVKKMIKKYKL